MEHTTQRHETPDAVDADNVLHGGDALLEPQATEQQTTATAPALARALHNLNHPWLSKITPPKHSAHTSQPSLLSTLRPPPIRYVPTLPRRVAKSGALSELQLEALLLIGQRHTSTRLASGARPGFLLADGPGVGKGRTQAAVILDAWLQGHQRALWVSASADLVADAHRDLKAVCTASPGMPPLHDLLIPLIGISHTSAIREPQGIVFVSYALLARPARLAQVLAWCEGGRKDYEGVVTLDECHRAKAAGATGVGTAVLRLQAELPLARVIYASATAATEVHNMRYLTRLGLWGAGTGSSSFNDFRDSITEAGAAAVELLPLHLKAIGAFACRTISFQGVSIAIATHELTDDQRRMYDRSAEVWRALARTLSSRSAELPASATSRFWSAHQRFFRLLVTASKLPLLHETLNRGLAQGKSVVVGLLGTGEAYGEAAARHANETTADAMLPFVDPTADDVVPCAACSPGEPALPSAPAAILRTTITTVIYPNVPQDDERVAKLLAQIESLKLPPNPLDAIMARLASEGVESVELSGRAEVAALRNTLRERFQLGQARVAVISDAASTGISLHAPVPPKGEPVRPRLHVTLELNWSADRQIQQLGRTHRTGQACPPEHVLLVSDVGGEQRFVSTVARRLQSLGALSGDDGVSRDGGVSQRAEGRWSDVLHSLETAEGSAALLHLYRALNYGGSEAFDSELGVSRGLLRDYLRLRVRLDESIDESDEAQARRATSLFVPKADLAAASAEDAELEPEIYDVTDDDDEHDGDDIAAAKAPPETLEEDAVEGAPEAIPFASDRHVRLVRSKLNKRLRRAVREMLPISRAQSPAPCAAPGAASPALPLPRSKATSVPLFLNRLLGLCIDDQRELLDLFTFLMARSRECTTPERRGGSDGGLSWYVGRGATGAVEGWARTGRMGALSGADTLLPSALILGRVHRVAAAGDASLYVFQLEELAPGCVAYGAARAAVEDQRADGFYAQRGGSGSDCFLRLKRASKRSPSPSAQPPEQWVLSASGERLPLSRAPQPLEPIGLGEAKLRWDAHAKRAEDAIRAASTLAPERPTTFLLCGALLFSLERVRRLLGNRPLALGRAMLATGQVAVGIVLDEDVAHALLSQAPSSAEEVSVVEAALPEREQQRWAVALAEALATQRSLQRALPVHDATQAWERCWAEIKQYETADLDTEELVERQRMEDALKDFQLDIERRKRARRQPPGALHANAARPHPSVVHGGASGSLATIAARAAAHGETTVSGPLLDSVEPSESVPPVPAMPGDIATAIQSTGLHSETKPPRGALPTIRRTPNFSPATKSVRTSSAAKRAAAKSKLHPLLQIASEIADS